MQQWQQLLDFYVKSGKIDTARAIKLFEQMRDAVVAGKQEPGPPSEKKLVKNTRQDPNQCFDLRLKLV